MSTGILVDAERLAAIVLTLPGVAGLHGGRFGEISTYLPGRRVRGVRIRDDVVTIGVVARDTAALPRLGDEVRTALGPLGRPVDVWVGDLADPDDPTVPGDPTGTAAPAASAVSLRSTILEENKS
ncbi:hypothetical protein [Amycolatopsis sp. PS_44_ISF1]|uniref:hypothetical protein n=1 Tax=Amycolatopsis sp. PS_44_ISF1 TaxID=2974917 RepID=UPI0028DDFFD7|nr:hypothetical protein [Amycolatopsis sp. PS_44_ISF1]MDT8910024.1 hypothetical protein [Amycolatopsis sp. PS_44_ISF1]